MSGQSRRASALETCLSTAIGYVVAQISQMLVFPLFDIHVSLGANATIGAVFTVISVIRGFGVRRLFNHLHVRGIL
jgi:hypothetical protein